MEHYFDAHWPEGRTMMRNTASIQVNLDIGRELEIEMRWKRAHDLGPVLAAAFANSPLDAYGSPTGWRSTRLAVWQAIDPERTDSAFVPGLDARSSWTRYTLDAPVMMIRSDDAACTPLDVRMPFGAWIANGHELGWPTIEDFDYHLTTLFPPVRPRGWLEFRMIDALPDRWWPVAVAVATTLLDDAEAADTAARAVASTRGCWIAAARDGLADPALRAAAARVLHRRARSPAAPGHRRRHDRRHRRVLRPLRGARPQPGRRRPARVERPPGGDDVRCAVTTGPSKSQIVDALDDARRRTLGLLDPIPAADQLRQVSELMSPLCWDLAHIGHYEELWLVRTLSGAEPTDPTFDDIYDAFKHPRRDRVSLPILDPQGAREYVADGARPHARACSTSPRSIRATRSSPGASCTGWWCSTSISTTRPCSPPSSSWTTSPIPMPTATPTPIAGRRRTRPRAISRPTC